MTVEDLILAHMEIVEPLARQAARRLPVCIDMDEMVSAGMLGLVQAAHRYDPDLHPSFAAFARLRVFGAIIDAFRGPHYPRRWEEMPEAWMQGGAITTSTTEGGAKTGQHALVPAALIDPQPLPDAVLIDHEQKRAAVVCITSARKRLSPIEGKTLDAHLQGNSMRKVGKQARRSGAWAHYTIHRAKTKLREAFEEGEKAA